jgi:hypothetical protein
MRKELEQKLIEKYPEMFKMTPNYPIIYGIECLDGWFDLLDILLGDIQNYLKHSENKSFEIFQIKQKFGGLRFYYENGDKVIDGIVRFAETMSLYICEICGTNQNLGKTSGWIIICCEDCSKKMNYSWKPFNFKENK